MDNTTAETHAENMDEDQNEQIDMGKIELEIDPRDRLDTETDDELENGEHGICTKNPPAKSLSNRDRKQMGYAGLHQGSLQPM